MKTRADAWDTVCRYVQERGLRRHMLAVSIAMADYARRLNEDAAYWETVGLLHDFDWEIHQVSTSILEKERTSFARKDGTKR